MVFGGGVATAGPCRLFKLFLRKRILRGNPVLERVLNTLLSCAHAAEHAVPGLEMGTWVISSGNSLSPQLAQICLALQSSFQVCRTVGGLSEHKRKFRGLCIYRGRAGCGVRKEEWE